MAYAFGHARRVPAGATREVQLQADQTAVLVIDVQRYASLPDEGCHKGVKRDQMPYFFDRVDSMVRKLGPLLDVARTAGAEVVYTCIEALTADGRESSLDYKLSGPLHVPKGSAGARVLEGISPKADDIYIPKTSCSVFTSTNVHYVLSNLGIRQLVVCGQLTNQCVESAVRDAADLGYLVTVVEDGCAAKSPEEHAAGLAGMRGFSRTVSCETAAGELSRSSAKTAAASHSQDTNGGRKRSTASEPTTQLVKKQKCEEPTAAHCAAVTAMSRALQAAGVKFLQVCMVDSSSQIRGKAMALEALAGDAKALLRGVGMVECTMALRSYEDSVAPGSGLSPVGTLCLRPDLATLQVLPQMPTHARAFGELFEEDGSPSMLCPRGFLKRMVREAAEVGIEVTVGVELEFILRRADGSTAGVDGSNWASTQSMERQAKFLEDLCEALKLQQVPLELLHAESAAGQFELVPQYSDALTTADRVLICRDTIAACARKHGLAATLLPKVFADAAGSGMHLHFGLRRNGAEAFCEDSQKHRLSKLANNFTAGIFQHLPALPALTTPSTNSFRRLVPGCWAGAFRCWGLENKEAPLRVCTALSGGQPRHVELKTNDATCNPYLAIGAVIAGGLDGVRNGLELPAPVSVDPAKAAEKLDKMPGSLTEALDALASDTLLCGALGERLVKTYTAVKRSEAAHFAEMALEKEVALLAAKGF
eukprot:TRINITY_DN35538_c0_g2_i1.p1 TRINITY_DN35538_c0_g2~~TRINITY_DN35538_c0_g2_i1.p1  ORF type:complete len:708 (-),score=170.74 TRINITY_DN35538_c0_g2_i1:448-2571(-)